MQGGKSPEDELQDDQNEFKNEEINQPNEEEAQKYSEYASLENQQSRKRQSPSENEHETVQKTLISNYNFRALNRKRYNDFYSDSLQFDDEDQEFQFSGFQERRIKFGSKKRREREFKQIRKQSEQLNQDEIVEYDRLPNHRSQLVNLLSEIDIAVKDVRQVWFEEQEELPTKVSKVSQQSIPIYADVKNFDFQKLIRQQLTLTGRLFDGIRKTIMMDPPWQLSSSQPSRGVAIGYHSLSDEFISHLPIPQLQKSGFIFIWAINAKYRTAAQLIKLWGYKLVDEIAWIKKTVNGKLAKSHGFYLQHAKENCLVGVKGNNLEKRYEEYVNSDIIWSQRGGQSQKPEQIYSLIQELIPQGFYLEIFGRRNNLQPRWVTIGNEI